MNYLLESLLTVSVKMLRNLDIFEKEIRSYHAYIYRLKILIRECIQHIEGAKKNQHSLEKFREDLSILYREADMIAELNTILKRTSSFNLDLEVKSLEQHLTEFVPLVVQIYGKKQSFLIVTPGFQQRSNLWE
ncbi:hypothetical protein J7E38_19720 [Bacillus sp. ISL-35]|uniref:hypothetical protein n=1 Tax=Bacillus sp. ISL-35 TaxID=2819122 RepID=UPI001BE5F12A|nr:hypothetical protein [Bacillus sp. ISL-35]MBT2681223.1 hypothetical protein [Bacillus sp. ISL-35]MBT2706134.1 hypothetical protein [Chryseobacterium sp. ISL-80]